MIEINNLTKGKIDERFLKKVGNAVLRGEGVEKENLSVVFVGAEKMRGLNRKYRKIDKATDVLSFQYISNVKCQNLKPQLKSQNFLQKKENSLLGEIVVCHEVVRKNAKKFDLSYNKEMAGVLIHGILHVLGYDHEGNRKEAERMERKENKYLELLF